MMYQVGLTQSSGRYEGHVIVVGEQFHQILSLFHPVAEVFRTSITFGYKWILHMLFHCFITPSWLQR